MKRLGFFLLFVLLVAFGLSFASLNSVSVSLNYYIGTVHGPLSLVIMITLILGAVLGLLASTGALMRQKREISRLRRKNELCEQEIRNLRQIPIRDRH